MSDSRRVVQSAPNAGSPGPPKNQSSSPGWRVDANSEVATVPQQLGRGQPPPGQPPKIRRSPGAQRAPAQTPPGGIRIGPPPPGRALLCAPTALDGLKLPDDEDAKGSRWRDFVYRITRIDLGPGRDSVYERGLRDRIRTGVGTAIPIAVLGLKGGVGKTAVVEALGSTFADVRDDRVIAVDIDAGDLADRHGRRSPRTMADLLLDAAVTRYSDVRAHTYMNSFGLEVLGLPDYARTDWRPERHDVLRAFSILRTHYSVVLVDCVKELNSSVMQAVLPESRALVVVSSPVIDAIRKTRTTLEWLCNNGYQRLMQSTVLAINHTEPSGLDTLAAKELELLSAHVAATVVVPFDRHVHEGKEIGLDRLNKHSRRSYLEMAAVLADMFPGRGMERDFRAVAEGHARSRRTR